MAEMWHVPPWELERADENGQLLQWAVRAFLWRETKQKKEERLAHGRSNSKRHW